MATDSDIAVHQSLSNTVYGLLSNDGDLYETVQTLIREHKTRLVLRLKEFDKIDSVFTRRVLNQPLVYLSAAEDAFRQIYENVLDSIGDRNGPTEEIIFAARHPRIGIKDWLGSHTVTPRGLTARLVNKLVCIEGIVTRCSLVHPKLCRTVHVSEKTGFAIARQHYDSTALQKDCENITRGIPKEDSEGNPFKIELALCDYKDYQKMTIQEMPESAPTGQLPRSVEVVLEEDLIDKANPGDRVKVWGIYRAIPSKDKGKLNGTTGCFLVCNYMEQLRQEALTPDISASDIRFIRDISTRADIFDLLSNSIAPSICGNDFIKKGLLLQLLGGQRKELFSGMKLRGDIHVLLIGDPSCGKSQMLRFMMNLSPLALSTTGRGSSGVGLTAAITSDKDTGERKLEAGAMVLGDGGLVCIDEFDKMSHEDRVAIHEVMEQQTVSISKAGIHTTLNARTSVLAAANPVYGSFDPDANLKSQISFPDSLLTRFDLIYIIRDAQTAADDRRICSQVLRQLQYRPDEVYTDSIVPSGVGGGRSGKVGEGSIIQPVIRKEKTGEGGYWDASIVPAAAAGGQPSVRKVISVDFLRKYIHYARHVRKSPILGDDAIESIATFYSNLRQICAATMNGRKSHVIPTARTLEACVRLATAHAKLKLKEKVDVEDTQQVQSLLLYTLLGEVPPGYNSNGTRIEPITQHPFKRQSRNAPDTPSSGVQAKRKRTREESGHNADGPETSKRQLTTRSLSHTDKGKKSTQSTASLQPSSSSQRLSSTQLSTSLEATLTENSQRLSVYSDNDDAASQASIESVESQGSQAPKITAKR